MFTTFTLRFFYAGLRLGRNLSSIAAGRGHAPFDEDVAVRFAIGLRGDTVDLAIARLLVDQNPNGAVQAQDIAAVCASAIRQPE